jgi:hypothetical protein
VDIGAEENGCKHEKVMRDFLIELAEYKGLGVVTAPMRESYSDRFSPTI